MVLVSQTRARLKFFGTLALALAQFLARSRAPEKSSALAFNSEGNHSNGRLIAGEIKRRAMEGYTSCILLKETISK